MSKMYKVVFNRKEVLVESNKVKTISKNKSEMNISADDVLDCLSKAKELFFNQFNYYAKSIEVVKADKSIQHPLINSLFTKFDEIFKSQKESA